MSYTRVGSLIHYIIDFIFVIKYLRIFSLRYVCIFPLRPLHYFILSVGGLRHLHIGSTKLSFDVADTVMSCNTVHHLSLVHIGSRVSLDVLPLVYTQLSCLWYFQCHELELSGSPQPGSYCQQDIFGYFHLGIVHSPQLFEMASRRNIQSHF